MSKRTNKFTYLYVIQGLYGHHGWEDVDQSESYRDTRTNLRLYRENEPQYSHRMIKRRELNHA